MAVFAGLAEVCATFTLPRLQGAVQQTFVWFVIGFPLSIVLPFFVLLWFRPKHLYAPGDYRTDPIWLTDKLPPAAVPPERKKPKFKAPRDTPTAIEEPAI